VAVSGTGHPAKSSEDGRENVNTLSRENGSARFGKGRKERAYDDGADKLPRRPGDLAGVSTGVDTSDEDEPGFGKGDFEEENLSEGTESACDGGESQQRRRRTS
jgi:hypothetical protein